MNFLSKFVDKMKKNKMIVGNGILYNKYLLYFILLISFTDLLYYAIAKKYIFIIIFFIIGYLTHFFSKNMTVIMCIALVFTNILSFGTSNRSIVNEGFTEEDTDGKKNKSLKKSALKKTGKEIDLSEIDKITKSVSFENESGVDGLNDKTKQLMETQKELMKNMKTLEPMLKQAEDFLEKFQSNDDE